MQDIETIRRLLRRERKTNRIGEPLRRWWSKRIERSTTLCYKKSEGLPVLSTDLKNRSGGKPSRNTVWGSNDRNRTSTVSIRASIRWKSLKRRCLIGWRIVSNWSKKHIRVWKRRFSSQRRATRLGFRRISRWEESLERVRKPGIANKDLFRKRDRLKKTSQEKRNRARRKKNRIDPLIMKARRRCSEGETQETNMQRARKEGISPSRREEKDVNYY